MKSPLASREDPSSGPHAEDSFRRDLHPLLADLAGDLRQNSLFATKGDEDSWQFTYMDVITLLFAVFVLLLALYGNQVSKQREVSDGMKAQSTLRLWKTPRPSLVEPEKNTGTDLAPIDTRNPTPTQLEQPDAPVKVPREQEGEPEAAPSIAEQNALAEISRQIVSQGLQDMITIQSRKEGLIITMKETLLFPSGKATLSPQGAAWIREIAPVLQPDADLISVEGHTDNVPIHTERFPSNWELSAGRASSVVRELVAAGIPPDKLRAVGYADSRPVAFNAFPSGREQNRRVQIKLSFSGKRTG